MSHPAPDPELAVAYLDGRVEATPLFAEATRLRDEGRGRVVTYSRKVFIPLTTLCRDVCTYCTFAKPPGAGGAYLEPNEVMAVALAGEERRCTEALFTLGDKPELRWPQARAFLDEHGCSSTIDYVARMSERVAAETALFPHANPGVMTDADIAALRPSNPSMGLMLENVSPRLLEPGMPHHKAPDKDPTLRLDTIAVAGANRVPFTTGILVGLGETNTEIVDSIIAIADSHARYGHVQEVIVQNFRAKADTPMRRSPEPIPAWFARVVAVTRWLLGPEMNVQVPPNLTDRFETYLDAGVNDWGGVSPLTIDWVNPEAPWPHLTELAARTTDAGFVLKPRLPVYPEFIDASWIDGTLLTKIEAAVDDDGYALAPQMEIA
ncbi:MAG: 7,8-didemethyl-8-hydroxy-5-deazariboflavin synthase CofG [Acidimicrobiia bacterium]|nr:7,8-didemethyl-8-hydroxy-5-deazariboflavin synthase CofG [Acidimicrobiia bacterium]MDH4307380.1 7,8-didemethyl-8-hydroxy-5-deazariboflavin synthase CofG [Acidimicrobiia bacterium]MDH5292997.1 7,8-didemethyl-8-hydroxy-5-deazariboflavin synthase CofG [Acidimicrobiia bacterium]